MPINTETVPSGAVFLFLACLFRTLLSFFWPAPARKT